MAGLESIALAVAHLERKDKSSDEESSAPGNTPIVTKKDNGLASQSPPEGSPFQATPRLVSTDIGSKNLGKSNSSGEGKEGDGTNGQSGGGSAPTSHTIQNVASTMTSGGGTTHNGTPEKSPPPATMGSCGRAVVIAGDRNLSQGNSANGSPSTNPEQFFRHQISQKILLKCKEEDGPSDHVVASLLARIAAVTDNLELLFRLMQELCEHGHKEYGEEKTVPGTDEEITDVGRNDVLSGRGGETNHHYGNVQYRRIVKACQPAYLVAKRRDKPNVAAAIVQVIRSRSGRFLKKKNAKSTAWFDVGNVKAREKSSQALREGAPELRSFVSVDASRRPVAMSPAVAQGSPPPRPGFKPKPQGKLAPKPASVEDSAAKGASKAPVVAKKGNIKHTAFLQAMQHYKNLYGKPAAEEDTAKEETPVEDGKRKASDDIKDEAKGKTESSIVETEGKTDSSKDEAGTSAKESSPPPAKRAKVEEGNSDKTE